MECAKGFIKVRVFNKDVALVVLGALYIVQIAISIYQFFHHRSTYRVNRQMFEDRSNAQAAQTGMALTSGSGSSLALYPSENSAYSRKFTIYRNPTYKIKIEF